MSLIEDKRLELLALSHELGAEHRQLTSSAGFCARYQRLGSPPARNSRPVTTAISSPTAPFLPFEQPLFESEHPHRPPVLILEDASLHRHRRVFDRRHQ